MLGYFAGDEMPINYIPHVPDVLPDSPLKRGLRLHAELAVIQEAHAIESGKLKPDAQLVELQSCKIADLKSELKMLPMEIQAEAFDMVADTWYQSTK